MKPTKTSAETAHVFETTWLSRYPRPSKVVCDKEPKFVGFEWDDLLAKAGIKNPFITSRNPQSNGLIERSHQAISQVIRGLVALRPPSNADEADKLIDTAFAKAMHASQCASNSQLNFYSPRSLSLSSQYVPRHPFSGRSHTPQQVLPKQNRSTPLKKPMPNASPGTIGLVIKYIALLHEKAKLTLSTPDPIRFIQFTQMVQSQFAEVRMF